MFKSIGFSLAGFVFLLIVFITYYMKKKYNSIKNSLFRFLMFLTLILTLEEILYLLCYIYGQTWYILQYPAVILSRLSLFLIIMWAVVFFFYIRNLDKKDELASGAKDKRKIYTYIFLASFVLCALNLCFKVVYKERYGIYTIDGPAVIYVYVIVTIIVLFLLINLLKSNYENKIKIPIYFIVLTLAVTTVFNLVILDINDISFLLSFFIISLYFTVESQDMMLLKELEQAKVNAEIKNKEKTEFLSNMSHEIRTPLNTILGFSQTLINETDLNQERIKEDISNIYESSVNLLELINNILDISRIESGKEKCFEKNYYLKDIIEELASDFSSNINKLDIVVGNNIPCGYYGDSAKIHKVLHNVIMFFKNNLLFSDITLSIDYNGQESGAEKLVFKVIANNKAMLENGSFEALINLGMNDKNSLESNSLDMVVAKRLLSMLDGTISIIDGEGYIIELEQKVIDNRPIDSFVIKKEDNSMLLDFTSKNILVVDDNKINLDITKKILEKYNVNVTVSSSGEECIQLVKNNKYDMIFLDHMMPNMDGIQTIRMLKEMGLNNIPIIVLTANDGEELQEQYSKEGFSDYLSKPINVNKLVSLLRKYLKKEGDLS